MEHKAASFEVPELERTLAKKKKRYVNYKEGMALYSMGRDSFRKLAKDADDALQHRHPAWAYPRTAAHAVLPDAR